MSFLYAATEPVVRLTPQARILGAVLAIAFMALILDLIRRDKLLERYSIVWFLLGIAMLLGAIFPVLLEWLARAMGVRDVTIALFSATLLVLLALSPASRSRSPASPSNRRSTGSRRRVRRPSFEIEVIRSICE